MILRTRSKVFEAAIKNESWGDGEPGVLRFPEDDPQAWKIIVYYMIHLQVPSEDFVGEEERDWLGLVNVLDLCWILGDKYDMPQFQDLIMLERLRAITCGSLLPGMVLRAFEKTPPGSKLRLQAARNAVSGIYHQGNYTLDDFDGLRAFPDAMTEMMNALQRYYEEGEQSEDWEEDVSSGNSWKDYMIIGGGPPQHWIRSGD